MGRIGVCESCGYDAGILALRGGLCAKCQGKPRVDLPDTGGTSGSGSQDIPQASAITRLLMAAAHLYPNDFRDDIKERLEHPYKARTPELGVDLDCISREVQDARDAQLPKSIFVLSVAVIALIILFQSPEDNWVILIPALLLTSLAEFVYARRARQQVRRILYRQDKVMEVVNHAKEPADNVVISGGFSPFIGSGIYLAGWSFVASMIEPEDESKPILPVSVPEVHERIRERLESLGLEGMCIDDAIYVNGKDVNLLESWRPKELRGKLADQLSGDYVKSKLNENDYRERHYRVARVYMWESQLVLSMYYRFLTLQDNLLSEARFFMLPPLKEKYLDVRNIPETPTSTETAEVFGESVIKGTFSWVGAAFKAFVFLTGGVFADAARKKELKRELVSNRLYNYGWETSLRENWSSPKYERYFQSVDKDVTVKLLTAAFLSALRAYLEEKNISTEDFSATTTKIVNEGVMISGGEVKAESLAVGQGASASKNAFNPRKGRGEKS